MLAAAVGLGSSHQIAQHTAAQSTAPTDQHATGRLHTASSADSLTEASQECGKEARTAQRLLAMDGGAAINVAAQTKRSNAAL